MNNKARNWMKQTHVKTTIEHNAFCQLQIGRFNLKKTYPMQLQRSMQKCTQPMNKTSDNQNAI